MRSKNGEAIRPELRKRSARRRLRRLLTKADAEGDLQTWRRAKGVLRYIAGVRVVDIAEELGVTRGSVNRWLQKYEADGVDGLRPRTACGAPSRLSEEQLCELVTIIEDGPQKAGFTTGVWTGPMIGELIHRRYGVKYHNHHIPRLLHRLGFSVQRPRKRLARADLERQKHWLRTRFPEIKKKPRSATA